MTSAYFGGRIEADEGGVWQLLVRPGSSSLAEIFTNAVDKREISEYSVLPGA